jgi:hypothetical protein
VPTSSFQHGDVGVVGSSESSSGQAYFLLFWCTHPRHDFFQCFFSPTRIGRSCHNILITELASAFWRHSWCCCQMSASGFTIFSPLGQPAFRDHRSLVTCCQLNVGISFYPVYCTFDLIRPPLNCASIIIYHWDNWQNVVTWRLRLFIWYHWFCHFNNIPLYFFL